MNMSQIHKYSQSINDTYLSWLKKKGLDIQAEMKVKDRNK